jgi:hypothetical protein
MTKVKLIRVLDIDNNCDIFPVSSNLDQSLNWETLNGDPATIDETCCLRFGYYWNSSKNNCYSKPNNGTRSFITQQAPSLAPTRFGAPVRFNAGVSQPVKTIITNYVLTNFDRVLFINTKDNNITVYLPSAATTTGREFVLQTTSSLNRATIQAYTGETVDGSSSIIVSGAGTTITVISNGTNFRSISSK